MVTKYTIDIPDHDIKGTMSVLGEASIEFDNENAMASKALIDHLRDELRPQIPKPVPTEPTGEVVVRANTGWFYLPVSEELPGKWQRDDDMDQRQLLTWEQVCEEGAVVYRREGTEPAREDADELMVAAGFTPAPAEPMIPASKVRAVKKSLQECAAAAQLESRTTHGDPGSGAYLDAADHLGDLLEEQPADLGEPEAKEADQ